MVIIHYYHIVLPGIDYTYIYFCLLVFHIHSPICVFVC